MKDITTDVRAVEQLTTALVNDCKSFTKRRGHSPQTMVEIMQSLATMVALYAEVQPELKVHFDQAFADTIHGFAESEE